MITREFNLYLHAGHSIPLVINCNQYDQGEQWLFTLFNADGTQYVPSSGAIVGIKSDNLGIINSGTVDSQGRVVINETQQMTAAVGKAVFELVIDDGTHGTANFVVLVEEKPGNNADLSESDISMIEEAIEAAANIKPYGSPLVASTVAGMTDHDKVYVYTGSETGYTSGHWYYWDGDSWEDGGVYNSVAVQTDTTLAISGMAADAKKTGDEISELKSQISTLSSIPREVKLAMDTLFSKIAVKDDDTYSSEYGTIHAWATAINVLSISAVFTQGDNEFYLDTTLDDLKDYLVVTASYDDGTSGVVSTYTLSGELSAGTNTVTVEYGGKNATFTVTVINGWNVTPDLTTATKGRASTNYTYNASQNTLRVYTSTAATYHGIYYPFTTEAGYEYHVTTDVTVTSGKGKVYFTANANNASIIFGSTTRSESGSIDMTLTHDANIGRLYFSCTYSASEVGDVTYSDFKIIKVPVGE